MPSESLNDYHTWRWLWAHAARQIIESIDIPTGYERRPIGYGCGIQQLGAQQPLLVLHPAGQQRAAGELSLALAGQPSVVLPRAGLAYPDYLARATRLVAMALASCLADPATSPNSHPLPRG